MLSKRELEQIVTAMNCMEKLVVNGQPFISGNNVVAILKAHLAKDDADEIPRSMPQAQPPKSASNIPFSTE